MEYHHRSVNVFYYVFNVRIFDVIFIFIFLISYLHRNVNLHSTGHISFFHIQFKKKILFAILFLLDKECIKHHIHKYTLHTNTVKPHHSNGTTFSQDRRNHCHSRTTYSHILQCRWNTNPIGRTINHGHRRFNGCRLLLSECWMCMKSWNKSIIPLDSDIKIRTRVMFWTE